MNIFPKQQIYYGAPGTGKSQTVERIIRNESFIRTTFHPDSDYSSFVGAYKPTMSNSRSVHCLSFSEDELANKLRLYYNDVGLGKTGGLQKFCLEFYSCLDDKGRNIDVKHLLELAGVPKSYDVEIYKYVNLLRLLTTQENKIEYRFMPQAFLKAYCAAWKQMPKPFFLIIEEINRGNCAQIFGDLFQLLDRDRNGYSKYAIIADDDLQRFLCNDKIIGFGELTNAQKKHFPKDALWRGVELQLPPNLYLWATMNTSDQSLFPIDSAFKRRWEWKYVKIANAYEKDEKGEYVKDSEGQKVPLNWKLEIKDREGNLVSWWTFLKRINEIISSMTSSSDKQLGYFFCLADKKQQEADKNATVISVNTFVNKVLFYLWNDVFKDYGFENTTLFRYKSKDDETGNMLDKDFTFPDFFDEEGDNIDTERVTDFVHRVMVWKKNSENTL